MESAFEKWMESIWINVNSPQEAAKRGWDAALKEAAKRFRTIPIMVGGSPANKPLYDFLDWLEGRTSDDL